MYNYNTFDSTCTRIRKKRSTEIYININSNVATPTYSALFNYYV